MVKIAMLLSGAFILVATLMQGDGDSQPSRPVADPVKTRAAPQRPATPEIQGRAAILRKKPDGHFWAAADVDGTRLDFLVDTGASSVVLTDRDAKRIGIRLDDLVYNGTARTANGTVRTATTRIEQLRVGRVTARNVEAIITEGELTTSLLGMSFLGALRSFEFKGENLILRE